MCPRLFETVCATIFILPSVFHACADSLVAPFTPLAKTVRKAVKLLGPIITERYINQKQYGKDWQGKPVRSSNCFMTFAHIKGIE